MPPFSTVTALCVYCNGSTEKYSLATLHGDTVWLYYYKVIQLGPTSTW